MTLFTTITPLNNHTSPMLHHHHHHGSLTTATKTTRPMCITLIQQTATRKHSYSSHDETLRKMERMMNLPSPPLSSSSEKVGKRWKEYQGIRNWDGLLDPLDDNLRAEILRYGHFVEAAYKSFEFDPSSPNYANCRFPKTTLFERCGLPNTGYKVTKHLRATSGIQLPNWIDKAPSWFGTQSSYVGYVAVCDNKEEIKRLGRRDVVIAFRGTTTCLEWLENLRANLTLLPCNMIKEKHEQNVANNNGNTGPMVESGFLSLYTSSVNSSLMSLQEMVREEIGRILQIYDGEPLSLTVTGHSLGAALATLAAYDARAAFPKLCSTTVISFGGPRVGNRSFRTSLDKQGTKVLRIVNCDDVITKVPGFVFDDVKNSGGDVANNGGFHVAGLPSWIQKRAEEAPWMYSEVGEELRLSSRDSPYLKGVNVATCHDLNTYLHLVDGFVSSTCPFRSTAKRFLQQR
ncbi:phospholipase A(1) DAD1, chloroplastic-like [Arachis duranensis]|uniref:Phospholipase A(1) DAD1, chloroplastic-like n=1 Tax=Arachis duranensis TaxID=130453 RepID=A0A6P4D4M3_ARADU|nr:phospholipase A(1) DAD1, chloroplastic-like [Arachis duranensis]